MIAFIVERSENIVGKGENVGHQYLPNSGLGFIALLYLFRMFFLNCLEVKFVPNKRMPRTSGSVVCVSDS